MNYKNDLAQLLAGYLNLSENEMETDILPAIETPPDPAMGQLAFPCFKLAKRMKKAPNLIAQTLCEQISSGARPVWLADAKPVNAYVNVYFNRTVFMSAVLNEVLSAGEAYGRSKAGGGQTVLVEYSSPNIAKHFSVGHLGTTVIGQALANILDCMGYRVVRLNYLGDWGTQFGKLITAYLKWGSREEIEETGIDGLTRLYVKFHEEADQDDSLNDEARSWVVRMQNGDEEGLSLWRWFCDLSMKEYSRVYQRLNIQFDAFRGESYYSDKMEAVARELSDKALLKESDGAQIVDLEAYNMPPCLILRRDGGTLYPTRDIAAAIDRYETYHFHKSLYVTGNEQLLHFAQWMKVVELMGYPWAKDMVHVSYGLFSFESGKMSTRRGRVIKMEDLINEAVSKTREIIQEKNPGLPDREAVAEQVGIGAVLFNEMYNSRVKDVLFSFERILNFEGETGPYVQYTHARACSVLEKAGCADGVQTAADFSSAEATDDESFEVVRLLNAYPEKISEAAEKYEPFLISRHLVALAQAFNKFYHAHTVLVEDANLRSARLAQTDAVRRVLASGLALLGIAAPKKM